MTEGTKRSSSTLPCASNSEDTVRLPAWCVCVSESKVPSVGVTVPFYLFTGFLANCVIYIYSEFESEEKETG